MKFNRQTAPLCADWVLALRAEFGDEQVQIVAVRENGIEIGEFSEQREGEECKNS